MTKRSFTGIMKYYLSRMTTVWLLLPAYAIIAAVLSAIMISGMNKAGFIEEAEYYSFGVNGIDTLGMFIMLIYGLCFATEFYNTAAGCGVSRRTSAIAQAVTWGITSALMSLESMIITAIYNAINTGSSMMIVDMFYGSGWNRAMWGESPALYQIKLFLLLMVIIWSCSMAGFLIGSLVYRLPRKITAVLFLAVPVGVISWFGNRLTVWEAQGVTDQKFEEIAAAFLDFFGMRGHAYAMGNMAKGGIVFATFGVVCALLAYVSARRASLKAVGSRSGI